MPIFQAQGRNGWKVPWACGTENRGPLTNKQNFDCSRYTRQRVIAAERVDAAVESGHGREIRSSDRHRLPRRPRFFLEVVSLYRRQAFNAVLSADRVDTPVRPQHRGHAATPPRGVFMGVTLVHLLVAGS